MNVLTKITLIGKINSLKWVGGGKKVCMKPVKDQTSGRSDSFCHQKIFFESCLVLLFASQKKYTNDITKSLISPDPVNIL